MLFVYDRLSSESERSTMYECEVSGLKEQLTSRDRVVTELNTELERVQQQITQLNNSYQTAQQQAQLAQHAMYVRLPLSISLSAASFVLSKEHISFSFVLYMCVCVRSKRTE